MERQQNRAQEIARATLGYRVYLNKVPNGYYWSDYPESSDDDAPESQCFRATPLEALKDLLNASDFLNDPATGEPMILVIR